MSSNNDWTCLNEALGLWEASYPFAFGLSRSILLRLKNNTYLLYSPGPTLIETAKAQVLPEDASLIILAPNSYHNLGIVPWKEAYPNAQIISGKKAAARLAKQTSLPQETFQSLESISELLPEELHIEEVAHSKIGEVWMFLKTDEGPIWIVCDAFFNFSRLPSAGMAKWMMKANRMGPGLEMSRVYCNFACSSRAGQKQWILNHLQQHPPQCLIPAHGKALQTPSLSEDIQQLVSQRL